MRRCDRKRWDGGGIKSASLITSVINNCVGSVFNSQRNDWFSCFRASGLIHKFWERWQQSSQVEMILICPQRIAMEGNILTEELFHFLYIYQIKVTKVVFSAHLNNRKLLIHGRYSSWSSLPHQQPLHVTLKYEFSFCPWMLRISYRHV